VLGETAARAPVQWRRRQVRKYRLRGSSLEDLPRPQIRKIHTRARLRRVHRQPGKMPVIPGAATRDGMGRELDGLSFVLFNYLPQIIMLVFSAHAMLLALHHVSNEPAEHKRNLRIAFVLTMGLLVSSIVASGFLPLLPEIVHIFFISVIFIHALFFNMFMFRLHEQSTHLTAPGERVSPPNIRTFYSRSDKTFYGQLNATLERDLLYASPGLTIKTLADAMQVREYMLRRFINQKLGYRNFNQFLNEFRVGKAIEILKENGESSAKISSIALDVGYASLSSFNKAFKELQGITPSVYRNRLVSS
jgi:AraC-like DNA-binding protein